MRKLFENGPTVDARHDISTEDSNSANAIMWIKKVFVTAFIGNNLRVEVFLHGTSHALGLGA